MPPALNEVVAYLDHESSTPGFPDFPGANNGLQFENSGRVTKIGAAVDGNLPTFELAAARGCTLLIVHHGMLWERPRAYTGLLHRKFRTLLQGDIAVYSSHLPLDAHPVLGNNACIADALGLTRVGTFAPHEGRDIGLLAEGIERSELASRLASLFPAGFRRIEAGPSRPRRIAVCSGNGGGVFAAAVQAGADTFITGEIAQQHFSEAVERGINLYPCGHYATEVFGVRALAAAAANHFGVEWEFLDTACPL